MASEKEWLEKARRWCFRARLEGPHWDGPVFERGEGSLLWDVEGNEYLDLNAGQICGVLGHSHPRIAEAVAEAARNLIHASAHFYNTAEIALAERLGMTLPDSLNRAFLRPVGLGRDRGGDGRREGGDRTLRGREPPRLVPRLFGVATRAQLRDLGRASLAARTGKLCAHGALLLQVPDPAYVPRLRARVPRRIARAARRRDRGPLAAIITEPLSSAGGVIVPPDGWLARVKEACSARGALLILDESQTGLAKLGTMWGFEHDGVVPDIVTVSKHFGGGIPISAVVTSDEVEQRAIDAGFIYAHSHSADPLACAAALVTLDVIEEDGLVERSEELGRYWRGQLERLAVEHEAIVDLRGRGVLQGLEVGAPDGSSGGELGRAVGKKCLEAGLLFSVRRAGSVFRFTIPFSTSEAQLDRAAEILDGAFTEATA